MNRCDSPSPRHISPKTGIVKKDTQRKYLYYIKKRQVVRTYLAISPLEHLFPERIRLLRLDAAFAEMEVGVRFLLWKHKIDTHGLGT